MNLETVVKIKGSTGDWLYYTTTTLHTEPYTFYETGSYAVSPEGEVSDFEMHRRVSEDWEARESHKKSVAVIRDIKRMVEQ